MDFNNWDLIINAVVIISALLAVVWTFGVVCRVERRLDISYKFFLTAIIAFAVSELAGLFNLGKASWLFWIPQLGKLIFALFFLAGIWTMRNMIRKIDGEK